MFSRLKHQLMIFGPLGAGLLIITLLTALGGLWQYRSELGSQTATARPLSSPARETASRQNSGQPGKPDAAGPGVPGQGNGPADASLAGSSPVSQSQNKPVIKTSGGFTGSRTPVGSASSISLALSVNGQSEGTVRLAAGSNQCDVLSQALAEGVISSLDMRYSSQYGTEAVYVINGIGDPGSVWWTYKVNGTAPPYGCAYVTAHGGDSVNWQYIK